MGRSQFEVVVSYAVQRLVESGESTFVANSEVGLAIRRYRRLEGIGVNLTSG
jgi:hypothetical protein